MEYDSWKIYALPDFSLTTTGGNGPAK